MAVKIRMTRIGRRHRPFFRINAIESRNPRDGKIIEKLGHYDPLEKDEGKQVVVKGQRRSALRSRAVLDFPRYMETLLPHNEARS